MSRFCIIALVWAAVVLTVDVGVADPIHYKTAAAAEMDTITAHGASGAEGHGWAGENHAVEFHSGGNPSGWGWTSGGGSVPTSVTFDNYGDTELGNQAAGIQSSSTTPEDMTAVQTVNANNAGGAGESLGLQASGGDISLGSSGNSGVSGSGTIGVAGYVDVQHADHPPPNVGLGKP